MKLDINSKKHMVSAD